MENLRELTQNDIKIMANCYNEETGQGLSKIKGITVDEVYIKIKDTLELSESKVRHALTTLVDYGYMDYGVKRGKKKTYHITENGCDYIASIKEKVCNIRSGE